MKSINQNQLNSNRKQATSKKGGFFNFMRNKIGATTSTGTVISSSTSSSTSSSSTTTGFPMTGVKKL